MDGNTIVSSVEKTGRCLVVQEAPKSFGVASEIIARINDKALLSLEAPVKRVTHYDVVTPYFGRELMFIPDVERIARGIEETLDF
jgi:pyruvate/2-oxoglutarate/acetoin dehydrogenase E1 component